jgi:hypothetical protein
MLAGGLQRRLGPVGGNPGRSPGTSGVATRKRPPTLTSDNQMTPKPNLALNAEIESSGRAANGTGNN